jgi:hypothetical protein
MYNTYLVRGTLYIATNSQFGIEVKQLLITLDDPTLSAEGFAKSIIDKSLQ